MHRSLASIRQLILIDGPAHGGSESLDQLFTLADCAGAAIDVLRHLRIDQPVDWVGNAWGGHVGLVFAARHADRCHSLTTIGTPVQALVGAERRRMRALVTIYAVAGPRPFIRAITAALLGPEARHVAPQAVSLVAEAFRRADRRGMYRTLMSVMLKRPDLTSTLGDIDCPALILGAVDDPAWIPAQASDAATLLNLGSSDLLPGAGRVAPLLIFPSVLAEVVTSFWQGSAPRHP